MKSVRQQRRDQYTKAGLTAFFDVVWEHLEGHRHPINPNKGNVVQAYQDAIRLAPLFAVEISKVAAAVNAKSWLCRPGNGVKDAHRILEKAAKSQGKYVPKDLLGAKLIVTSLQEAYSIAAQLPKHLEVREFHDRFLQPQPSGYRDLQFEVRFEALTAEVKICHAQFDEADSVKHRVYEIVRTLENRAVALNRSERLLLEQLRESSRQLYAAVWQDVLKAERSDRYA